MNKTSLVSQFLHLGSDIRAKLASEACEDSVSYLVTACSQGLTYQNSLLTSHSACLVPDSTYFKKGFCILGVVAHATQSLRRLRQEDQRFKARGWGLGMTQWLSMIAVKA